MASDQSFIEFIVEQMADAGTISFKKMFGEYALYCDGKVIALVCKNQLFIKETDRGRSFIGEDAIVEAPPYPGASLYFLVEDKIDDRQWLSDLVRFTAQALPPPKPKQPKTKTRKSKKGKEKSV
jgi:TfoX/Sxy family transcriptional regulator of competence genes